MPSRRSSAAKDVSGDQDPAGVADLADRLAVGVHLADEVEDLGEAAKFVGRPAAGDQQAVIVVGVQCFERKGYFAGNAIFAVVKAGLFGGEVYLPAFFSAAVDGVPDFKVFEVFADQLQNLLAHIGSSMIFVELGCIAVGVLCCLSL